MRETYSPSSRRRITSFGWLKPWVTKLCEAEPELEIYLREGASDNHHFLAIVNRALARTGSDWRAKQIAYLLRTQPRKRILRLIWPQHPRGLISAPHRMGAGLHSRAFYDRVLKHLARPASAKVLRHARFISTSMLKALDVLDPRLQKLPLIELLDTSERLHSFLYMNAVLERVLPARRLAEARQALWRVRTYAGIGDWFERWLKKSPLPPTPWQGTQRLRPLASLDAIAHTAHRFTNCLTNEVPRAVTGSCYFYEWRGREPAVVSIVADPMLGWVVEAVYGVENRMVRTGTRDAIIREFAEGGIVWRPNPAACMEQDAFKVFVNEINAASGLEWMRKLVKRTGAWEQIV